MKRASYREAVAWIALNDNTAETEEAIRDEGDSAAVDLVCSYISTKLVADLFGKTSEKVAFDIVRLLKKIERGFGPPPEEGPSL